MARRLVDGVWLLDLGLRPPLASNAYLVDGEGIDGHSEGVTLVDAGLFLNRPTLPAELAAAGYEAADIDRVLLTHYDLDHVGGLRVLPEDTPVFLGGEDLALVRGEWDGGIHHKGLFHRLIRPLFSLDGHPVSAVSEGDHIGGFVAYHTPGHNPGHTVYHHKALSAAFLGDLVWEEDGQLTVPFWLDSYDMHTLRRSVRTFADRSPPFDLACMGHGAPILTDGDDAVRRLAASL